jgi:hypothetical protein
MFLQYGNTWTSLASKVGTLPLEEVSTVRGSGWVDDQYAKLLMILNPDGQPTRYRGVVLTVSKRELGLLRQSRQSQN